MGQDVQYNGQTWHTLHLVGPDNVDAAGLDNFTHGKLKAIWADNPTAGGDYPLWLLFQVGADAITRAVKFTAQLVVRPSGVYQSPALSQGGVLTQGARLGDSTALLPLLKD